MRGPHTVGAASNLYSIRCSGALGTTSKDRRNSEQVVQICFCEVSKQTHTPESRGQSTGEETPHQSQRRGAAELKTGAVFRGLSLLAGQAAHTLRVNKPHMHFGGS